MGKYLMFYKEPLGMFRVEKNKEIYIRYSNAQYYLNSYNTYLTKIISDLKMLDNHIGALRGYLNTDEAYLLNREGRMIMELLESFIISWKSDHLVYYKALVDVLNRESKARKNLNANTQAAIDNLKSSTPTTKI